MSVEMSSQLQKPEKKRQRDRAWYERARENPEFRERNRERVRIWRENNIERSRETTRLIMRRLDAERHALAHGLPLPLASSYPPRRRSSTFVKLVHQQQEKIL